ncbi:hypothetical protein [Arthrobacter castelli]|uniref:hypothetical protein n=1 Tax=Arthrobacter castelli TaxID=271431 RepID=UPI0012DFD129|nr:hypothetical protein [Arthrobacter castelli]
MSHDEPPRPPLPSSPEEDGWNEAPTSEIPLAAPVVGASEAAETPIKLCKRCSVQTRTDGNFCPHCAAPYGTAARSKGRKRIVLALVALLVLGGIGTGTGLIIQHNNEVAAQEAAADKRKAEAAAAEERRAEAAERAAAKREAQKREDQAERVYRELVVEEMEKSILDDAKERVATGILTGPIVEVSCTPMAGGSTDDLTALTGSYDCIAVNEEHDDGTASGYRFSATTNWDEASYSWHLGG